MRALFCLLIAVWPAAAHADDKPAPITGETLPGFEKLDTFIARFIADNEVPGAAVAVCKDGRLVFARGFGYADRAKKIPAEPTSLFRLASVCKPFTLAAVCLLVERRKLRFEDRVLEILKLKTPASMDERWRAITVEHLVMHQAGFDHSESDPMFDSLNIAREFKVPPPARQEQIIQHVLRQPLAFRPGEKVAYANFGYCLLGRVIEKASGKSYEQFVKDELLKPLGLKTMQLGKTMTTAKGEVRYEEKDPATANAVFANFLGKKVPSPYGAWCLEAMDSHGGWIASAVEVARFGSAIDFPDRFPVMKGKNIDERFSPEYFHYGAFSGSATLFHRRSMDRLVYVVLFNGRLTLQGKELSPEVHPALKDFFKNKAEWPEGDLFGKFMK